MVFLLLLLRFLDLGGGEVAGGFFYEFATRGDAVRSLGYNLRV